MVAYANPIQPGSGQLVQRSMVLLRVPTTSAGPTVTQEGFRWRNDDGSETSATWAAAQDTNTSLALGTATRLRVVLDATGDPPSALYTLYYKKTTDSTWLPVPVGPTGIVGRTTSFTDDFNRANAGDLTTPWATLEGNHPISSNHVVVGSSSPNVSYYNATFANDHWAEADVAGQVSVGFTCIGVCVRVTGSDFYYAWVDGTHASLLKRVSGSYIGLATGTITLPSSYRVRLEAEGTTIRLYIDGVLDITVTDSSLSGGRPGIISANGAGATLDNFACGVFTAAPNPVYVAASSNITAGGEATTAQLAAPAGKTTTDFLVGRMWDDENGTDSVNL